MATSLKNLGVFYYNQKKYRKAKKYFNQALKVYNRIFGENHPLVASTLNDLGNLYTAQGGFAKAEGYYKKSIEINKKIPGEEHPDYSTALEHYAQSLRLAGREEDARIIEERIKMDDIE